MSEKVVIIGGGHAGGQVAIGLRQAGFDGSICLVCAEGRLPYQRPPLSKQVLCSEFTPERCLLKAAEFYEQHGIQVRRGTRAGAVDPAGRRVELEDSEKLDYDRLVLATGSRLRRLNIPGADLDGIHYLREMDDALAIARELQPGRRIVVVGGGYIGMEVAASAAKLDCRVTVVEMEQRLMGRVSPPVIAEFLQRYHQERNVRFRLGAATEAFVGSETVSAVRLADGTQLEADAVIVGVGVIPNTELAADAGLETGIGIRVDAQGRTGAAGIYAAGDVTEFEHPVLERTIHLESVQNAVGQARAIAREIAGSSAPNVEIPWFWTEQFDLRVQMAGLIDEDQQLVVRGDPDSNAFSVFGLRDGRVEAVQSIQRPKDYMVGRKLITARAEVPPEVLADPDTDLKEFSKQ